jgi:SAM-dependent methyltransferase
MMQIPRGHEQNADQIAYWNGPGGQRWTDRQASQDILLAPICDILVDRANAAVGDFIIDVGCGCGATTMAFAHLVGPSGRVLGVDISAPMLARARQAVPSGLPIEFILADATVQRFQPQRFDLVVSRFGVMFFAEPAVSFANLRRALKPSGRLAFACWRDPRDNPWITLPLQAVHQHVAPPPPPGPDVPGPFAFASEARVMSILSEAGFTDVKFEACDLSLDIAIGRGLDSAVASALDIGPASRALEGQPAHIVAAAIRSVREALAPFVSGASVSLGASVWIVTADAC